jgi:hypothetical protein
MEELPWIFLGLVIGLMIGSLLGAQLSWASSRENPVKRRELERLEQVWFENTVGKPDDLP